MSDSFRPNQPLVRPRPSECRHLALGDFCTYCGESRAQLLDHQERIRKCEVVLRHWYLEKAANQGLDPKPTMIEIGKIYKFEREVTALIACRARTWSEQRARAFVTGELK